MKKRLRTILPIIAALALLAYGIYWAFFDIRHIAGQELLREVPSPNGGSTLAIYLNNGGATTGYAVLGTVKDHQTGRTRNIYWQAPCADASVQWLDADTVSINGVVLDVWKDAYDYRND